MAKEGYSQTNQEETSSFKQYLRIKSENDFRNYQMQRNKAKQLIRKAKMKHKSLII